jgi:AcrR family transcriptional regulator
MAPDERRRAIVEAVIPLLAEHGGDVSTRQIAEAAGVAEGTIFRVFPDKFALLMAAAHEALHPADSDAQWEEALADVDSLHDKVRIAAERVFARMSLAMPVMLAVRSHFLASARADKAAVGPPGFKHEAQHALQRQLESMFEPHRDELAVTPETAALTLRALIIGCSRAAFGPGPSLDPDQIADLVLGGILRKDI